MTFQQAFADIVVRGAAIGLLASLLLWVLREQWAVTWLQDAKLGTTRTRVIGVLVAAAGIILTDWYKDGQVDWAADWPSILTTVLMLQASYSWLIKMIAAWQGWGASNQLPKGDG